jgi:hypothetical protein
VAPPEVWDAIAAGYDEFVVTDAGVAQFALAATLAGHAAAATGSR